MNLYMRELLASVVVFLVALPLCMGIAIAAGVPPIYGLVAGMIGGLVVGPIAGSPLQVSGPAAGLVVVVYELVESHGILVLGPVVFVAGLVQILAGYAKVGRWFRLVSPSVIHGMLGGIGVLIFASQFHVMVDDTPAASGVTNLATIPSAVMKGVVPLDGSPHHLAAAVGVLTLIILVGYTALRPKLPGFLSLLPAPLIAVFAGSVLAGVMQMQIRYVVVPESLMAALPSPMTLSWSKLLDPSILGAALALALIASAESLLCASAVDKLHDGPRSDLDRELMAQGVGNTVAGILGVLPLTGVIVRSSANVDAGATTRWSAVIHGVWLVLAVVAAPWLLALIPVASLAAVLVYIGWKLLSPLKNIKEQQTQGLGAVGVYVGTVVAIVAVGLLEGLAVGMVLSVLHLAWHFSHLQVDIDDIDGVKHARLTGSSTFMALPDLSGALSAIDPKIEVHVHLESLGYIDHACIEWLSEWANSRPGEVVLEWERLRERGSRAGRNPTPVPPVANTPARSVAK